MMFDKISLMRVFLTLLLCFVVAFQGGVSARAFPFPCPMDHVGGSSVTKDKPTLEVGDCCNDAETVAKTGKLCKTDVPCSSSSACVLASFLAPVPSARTQVPVFALTASIATFDPSGVWRPPALS